MDLAALAKQQRLTLYHGNIGTLIARGYGSLMDHAVLLCSLFLGAGLNSFVATGQRQGKHHVWVVTFDGPQNDAESQYKEYDLVCKKECASMGVVFEQFANRESLAQITSQNKILNCTHWDVLCGTTWKSYAEIDFPFERLVTLFNHDNIWLNIQKSDAVIRPAFSWDLNNATHWLPFLSGIHMEDMKNQMNCFCTF
jgi:hypothetical protein